MNHTKDINILEKLEMFSLELEQQQPVVECEFFRFDWGLVFNVRVSCFIIKILEFMHEHFCRWSPHQSHSLSYLFNLKLSRRHANQMTYQQKSFYNFK